MSRSPYHLTSPHVPSTLVTPGRRLLTATPPQQHQSRGPNRQTGISSEEHRSSTPPLEPEDGDHHELVTNPMFQPRYGSYASRYGTSRSIRYDTDVVLDGEDNYGSGGIARWGFHPLQKQREEIRNTMRTLPASPVDDDEEEQPLGYAARLTEALKNQFVKIVAGLSAQPDDDTDPEKTSFSNLKTFLFRVCIPVALFVVARRFGFFGLGGKWDRLEERHLDGRQCVMNLFVDKQDADEFNPDYSPENKKPEPMEGTYRTKGQVEVINRFISSVAAAFRPNVQVQQHVVFAGTRDGGHLAKEALKHWPARGSYRTQLHVIADDTADELEYESLEEIEDQFQESEDVHIYDFNGNIAGHTTEDDDALDEALRQRQKSSRGEKFDSLPEVRKLVFDPDEEEESVIPYMHVDGTTMSNQMDVLAKTTTLLKDRKVVVVGLEHSPDLDVNELIDFFREMNYKTFMLGLRQLTRIDNLCPEILQNVMQHPSLDSGGGGLFENGDNDATPKVPPFFVAMPRGRHSKEEMSIQHMYDLFSGSGLLQVKTANDRVANVK